MHEADEYKYRIIRPLLKFEFVQMARPGRVTRYKMYAGFTRAVT